MSAMTSADLRTPLLDRNVREDIAKQMYQTFGPVASHITITFDTHAIQVVVFPPSHESFRMPSFGPITGVMRDGHYTER